MFSSTVGVEDRALEEHRDRLRRRRTFLVERGDVIAKAVRCRHPASASDEGFKQTLFHARPPMMVRVSPRWMSRSSDSYWLLPSLGDASEGDDGLSHR